MACDPGTYAPECYSCMAGTYASGRGSTHCLPCEVGRFANQSGASACQACTPGSFQYSTGNSGCVACAPGTFQPERHSTACLQCSAGSAQAAEGMAGCEACMPGHFAWSDGSTACAVCASGSHQPGDGATTCAACGVGSAQDLEGMAACQGCAPGMYQPEEGRTACWACGDGEFQALAGSTACALCPAGTTHRAQGQAAPDACLACPPGQFKAEPGGGGCAPCSAGQYAPNPGASGCGDCAPGYHQPLEGASACLPCAPGTYGLECAPCRPGTYSRVEASVACRACAAGAYSTGWGSPAECPPCPLGTHRLAEEGGCIACPERAFCPEGSARPVLCEAEGLICSGDRLDAGPGMLAYLNGTSAVAIACPPGTLCALGGEVKGLLEAWPNRVHFVVLWDGSHRRVDWPYVRLGGILFWLAPRNCQGGWYLRGEECAPCRNGTFSARSGAMTARVCRPCAPGRYASSPGAIHCPFCQAGTYASSTGMLACPRCWAGGFQSASGGSACHACLPGKYSASTGGSACSACLAGTVQPARGGSACIACNASAEYSSEGDALCLPCAVSPTPVPPLDPPPEVWVAVRGPDDLCIRRAESTTERVLAWRLGAGTRCRHVLRALGRSGEYSSWDAPATVMPAPARLLVVVARNETFYPEECRRARLFEVFFTLWDGEGALIPGPTADADLSILDSTGGHLLFRAKCELSQHACATRAFCPTVDVLVRVSVAGVSGSVRIKAGHGQECPPPPGWSLALLLAEGASQPFLPGEAVRVGIHVLNPPSGHLLAYRLSLQVFQPFAFVDFEGFVGRCEQELDGRLVLRGDLSALLAGVDLLGRLTLRLGTGTGGLVPAVRVLSAEFMLLQGAWLAVPVQCGGFACGRDHHLRVLVDHPRPTALIASVSRQTLVFWQGVQPGAGVFPAAIEAWAVGNTGGLTQQAAAGLECRSVTPRVLRVVACSRIEPVGPGKGVVRVRLGGVETSVFLQVLQPRVMRARFLPDGTGRRGRVEVLATLDGAALDITPFVLGRASSPGVSVVLGDELRCLPDFVGEFALGEPVLLSGACPPASRGRPDLRLLSGGWTRRGGYALNPGTLLMGHAGADILLHEAEVFSEDPGRAVVREDGRLYMVLGCQTPREVVLRSGDGWAWTIQVVPPAPASLRIEMSATVLAVQQDVWGGLVVPDVARLVKATLLYSDGSSADVTQSPRLLCSADSLGLRVLPGCAVQTFTEAGLGELLFGMRGLGCVSAAVQLRVFASSVVNATLTCPTCPDVISARDDPLAVLQQGIPLAAFVVRRLLVDGRVDSGPGELRVEGDGVLEQTQVAGLREGELVVTAPHATGQIRVRVVARWATGFRLLCNDSPSCAGAKLAPPGDGAGLAPFGYATRLDLILELLLANDTTRRYDQLPQVSILFNGSDRQPALVPGDLELRVVFSPAWNFAQPEARFVLRVATLVSLELEAPALLRQLHCTRVWERLPLRVLAGLSDGRQAQLPFQRFHTTGVLRVTPMGLLYAVWEGEGVVSTRFAGRTAQAGVAATFDNRLFTGVDLHVPATFRSGLGDLLPVVAALVPQYNMAPGVQSKALRWVVAEPGVLAEAPGDTLALMSDFPGPIRVSAIVRSCQGADPVVEERAVQVNVVPTRKGQVDFGADAGPPMPQVQVGETLEIPVFVYAPDAPLLGFRATVSLPGLDRLECAVGELPLSACEAHQAGGSVALSGAYPASQRTGRLHLGSLRGRVILDALSRLRVALHTASFGPLDDAGNVTYEFAVRLGRPRRARSGLNSVTPGLLGPLVLPAYEGVPRSIQACCGAVLAIPGTGLSGLLPKSFQLERVWLVHLDGATADLSLDDLRLEFHYDPALLTHAHGLFTAQTGALGTTEIRVVYTEAGSLRQLSAALSVVFARPLTLELDPPRLELRRLHCAASSFQTGRFQARLVLADVDEPVVLQGPLGFASTDTLVLTAEPGSLQVEGLRVGEAGVLLTAFGLEARAHIQVRDDSVLLRELTLEDPYVLSSARDEPHRLRVRATWEDGGDWQFIPSVQADGPVTLLKAGLITLVARGNTHPASAHRLSVTVPACQNQSRITARARLVVRLLANLTRQRPVDLLVSAGESGFNASLVVAEGVSVSAVFIRLHTDTPLVAWSLGPDTSGLLIDCALDTTGKRLLLAAAGGPTMRLLVLVQPMPFGLWGDVEVFDGTSTVRVPITAGQFGAVHLLPAEQKEERPVVDAGTLARLFRAGSPDVASVLRLLTERERMVDVRLYSNEQELSVMLRIVDRFLRPDDAADPVTVLLQGEDGLVSRQPASHVVDGWYAYQFMGDVPRRTLRVSYELLSRQTEVPDPFVTGRAVHACPRVAMDRASFQLVYRLHAPPPENLAGRVACMAHVAPRRVRVEAHPNGVFTLTVAVESFIRIQQAHQAIMNDNDWRNITTTARRRLVQQQRLTRTGLLYINDTADTLVFPCPPGTYYSANGTYERLPLHALSGPDCYGMVCTEGYTLLAGHECVPAALGLDVVWVCVWVILGLVGIVSCGLCLVHVGKLRSSHQGDAGVAPCVQDVSWPTDSSGEPFLDDDDPEFKNILAGSYLDDYARTLLDDEFSAIPMNPPVTRC